MSQAAKRKPAKGGPAPSAVSVDSPAVDQAQVALASVDSGVSLLVNDPLPVVRVNKVNLAEIKTALDDIVKKACPPPVLVVARLDCGGIAIRLRRRRSQPA